MKAPGVAQDMPRMFSCRDRPLLFRYYVSINTFFVSVTYINAVFIILMTFLICMTLNTYKHRCASPHIACLHIYLHLNTQLLLNIFEFKFSFILIHV